MLTFDNRILAAESLCDSIRAALDARGAAIVTGVETDSFEAFAARFGPLMPQYDGSTSFSIRYTPDAVSTYYSLSKQALNAHTDGHDLDLPPRIFVLGCITQSADAGGHTEVSDSHALLSRLSAEELQTLRSKPIVFRSNPLVGTGALAGAAFPIWDVGRDIFRFSTTYLRKQAESDRTLATIMERVLRFHEAEKESFRLSPGDALIIDNHRMLHSRSAFDDGARHLVRMWVGPTEKRKGPAWSSCGSSPS